MGVDYFGLLIHSNCCNFMELVSHTWRMGGHCTDTQKHKELHCTFVTSINNTSSLVGQTPVFQRRNIEALEALKT